MNTFRDWLFFIIIEVCYWFYYTRTSLTWVFYPGVGHNDIDKFIDIDSIFRYIDIYIIYLEKYLELHLPRLVVDTHNLVCASTIVDFVFLFYIVLVKGGSRRFLVRVNFFLLVSLAKNTCLADKLEKNQLHLHKNSPTMSFPYSRR